MAALAGLFLLVRFTSDEPDEPSVVTVTVPDIRGLHETEAARVLAQSSLRPGARTESSDPVVPAGQVAGQTPPAGRQVPPGTRVDYVVSQTPGPLPVGGPSLAPTPQAGLFLVGDYRCLTLADATADLAAADLLVGSIAYTLEGGPVDDTWLVERQSPQPGQRVGRATAVDLILSSPYVVCRE